MGPCCGHGKGVSDRHRGLRSSAATVSSWCDALAAHHKCGSVFSAQFCPFQADINFSHGSVAAQIWNAFPPSLPFPSSVTGNYFHPA